MPQLDIQAILLYIIPGFVLLKSFYMVLGIEKKNQFEYFIMSVFWSLILMVFYEIISPLENFSKLLDNINAASIVLLVVGMLIGLLAGYIFKTFARRGKKH